MNALCTVLFSGFVPVPQRAGTIWSFFNFQLGFSCAPPLGFWGRYWQSLAAPIALLFVLAVVALLERVLSKCVRWLPRQRGAYFHLNAARALQGLGVLLAPLARFRNPAKFAHRLVAAHSCARVPRLSAALLCHPPAINKQRSLCCCSPTHRR